MEPLLNANKEPEDVYWDLGHGSTTFLLPQQTVQIVYFVKDGPLSDVKGLGQCLLEMQQPISKLQIRI